MSNAVSAENFVSVDNDFPTESQASLEPAPVESEEVWGGGVVKVTPPTITTKNAMIALQTWRQFCEQQNAPRKEQLAIDQVEKYLHSFQARREKQQSTSDKFLQWIVLFGEIQLCTVCFFFLYSNSFVCAHCTMYIYICLRT